MKKLIKTAIIITACVGLCAGVWPRDGASKEVPAEPVKSAVSAELPAVLAPRNALPIEVAALEAAVSTEKEKSMVTATLVVSKIVDAPLGVEGILQSVAAPEATPTTAVVTSSDDPYRTDVYPKNIYSEKLIYNADGEFIRKSYTIPTAFGPDTIWVDGRAYYDIPGFRLVEWSGPGERTEDYTMYESGNKVGIMGGEEESPATATPSKQPEEQPIFTGQVIDQTINAVPERTDTTLPDDPDARIIP